MSAAIPDREIRLSEITTELRNLRDEAERWRARWAQDGTEYRQQIRELTAELDQTRRARDAARTTNDMLTDHCESQGRRIAFLDLNVETERECGKVWLQRSQANFARADKLAAWIEFTAKEEGYTHDDLADLIREAGVECEACNGSGVDYPCGPGEGDWADVSESCDACKGIGRQLR